MNEEGGNTLPGGDSWIVYPNNGKLYGSIRLEAMRDGIADYTLLKMLERRIPNWHGNSAGWLYSTGHCMIPRATISATSGIKYWKS